MPKTDIKKIESEDLRELSDEALDEARSAQGCFLTGVCFGTPPSD